MEPVFLRVGDGQGCTRTYPLSAYQYLTHNSRGHLHIVIGDRVWSLANCPTGWMIVALEDAIIQEIATAIRMCRDHQGPSASILDLNAIADRILVELQLEADEAQAMARLDDMIAAAERDGETGYDGARADHSDLECMGGRR